MQNATNVFYEDRQTTLVTESDTRRTFCLPSVISFLSSPQPANETGECPGKQLFAQMMFCEAVTQPRNPGKLNEGSLFMHEKEKNKGFWAGDMTVIKQFQQTRERTLINTLTGVAPLYLNSTIMRSSCRERNNSIWLI